MLCIIELRTAPKVKLALEMRNLDVVGIDLSGNPVVGLGKRETFELARKGFEFMCAGDGGKQDSAAKKLRVFHASIVFNISTAMIRSVISFYSLGNGHLHGFLKLFQPVILIYKGRLAVAAAHCLDL
ncbi:hypothetical protein D5086_007849 [Populus alba]|uniref:Uncharacterized protein n=1 Tax=Populus alba TaxID=43335 RepID=A0ACC4CEZ7_POPAL